MEGRERVAEFGRELREGPEPSDRSVKEIIDALKPQLQELVDKQVELARTELVPVGRQAGIATSSRHRRRVHARLPHLHLYNRGVRAQPVSSLWLSALIVSGVLLLIGVILAASGANILRRLDPVPHRTIRALQQNINWLKGQFRS